MSLESNHQKKALLIVSDTPMYSRDGKEIAVFEPTLREVEALTQLFQPIIWMGFDYGNSFPANVRATPHNEIRFIRLPKATGGDYWYEKIRIIKFIPALIWNILRETRKFGFIHTRGPSLPAAVAIIADFALVNKKFWHKYAGNWRQQNPPASYGLQRWLLKKSGSFIAVNGRVSSDSAYIRQFENPCFYKTELLIAAANAVSKGFDGIINLLFVGRMEREKGAFTILEVFPKLTTRFSLSMVGVGKDLDEIQAFAKNNGISNVEIMGALSRDQLNHIYAKAHLILLPTVASEGFPKVLAEAAGFGCIPMVTALSSIPDYIKDHENGFLLKDGKATTLLDSLQQLPSEQKLKEISARAQQMAALFSYEQYIERIRCEFISQSA